MNTKQQGFTLIELILVVVILGLLIATLLPRFATQTDEIIGQSVENVAGKFAAAVGIIKAQWEIEGRKSGNNGNEKGTKITYEHNQVGVDGELGYPTGNAKGITRVTSVDKRKCKDVLDLILELPPTNTTSNIDAEIADFEFVVREDASSKSALCVYYSVASIGLPENSTPANGTPDGERFDGFTYNPTTGQVSVF